MFTKPIAAGYALFTVFLTSVALLSQAPPTPSSSIAGLEFPVIMRQKVVAGTTSVGTKVQAKLAVATLVNGVVVPQDAILSGEVIESAAKSAGGPSRLAIRMDSVQWKNGSAPKALQLTTKVFLTAWYYPAVPPSPQDLSDKAAEAARPSSRHPNNAPFPTDTYPTPNSPASQPFPGRNPNSSVDTLPPPPAPASGISQHRVLMKNVESAQDSEGTVSLTSKWSNIKIDKTTTYVLATGDLAGGRG